MEWNTVSSSDSSIQERPGDPGMHPAEDNKGDKGTGASFSWGKPERSGPVLPGEEKAGRGRCPGIWVWRKGVKRKLRIASFALPKIHIGCCLSIEELKRIYWQYYKQHMLWHALNNHVFCNSSTQTYSSKVFEKCPSSKVQSTQKPVMLT